MSPLKAEGAMTPNQGSLPIFFSSMGKMIPVEERKYGLSYYHANLELMNVQSYLSKLNKSGRMPFYAQMFAYQLYKDDAGKWRMSDAFRQVLKDLAHKRLHPEEAPPAPVPAQPAQVPAQ